MPTIVLGCICLAAALLLSVINTFTAPIITERENEKANAALSEVLPGGSNFEKLTLNENYPSSVLEAYSADGGFVFRTVGAGRNGDVVIMVGVDTEGKITGTQVISEGESKGYKEKVFAEVVGTDGKYTGQTLDSFEEVIVGGATLTSKAFSAAVKAALQGYAVANGGSVDLRDPQQILQDNCNAALGTEGKTFEKWFAYEVLEGVDAIYYTEGGTVAVVGEAFVGIGSDGQIVGEVDADTAAVVNAAYAVYSGASLTEIAIPDGASKRVKKISKSLSGSYVFELEAAGYQAGFEYGNGEYIKLKLAISADGKIISVVTLSHSETQGVGDKCATEDYYKQYEGKGAEDIVVSSSPVADKTDPGVIAGATYTTQGYQKAVKAAFDTVEILKGDASNE